MPEYDCGLDTAMKTLEVCVVSVDRLAVITWSGAGRTTTNCRRAVKSHELRRHVPLESYIK
jgi:hypothetical protein